MITCQEEVFSYFKTLSGSKRIEVMCGLMSMCIPLEIRFLEAVLQDQAKMSFGSFRDADIKANSRQELEQICKCDLLIDRTVTDHDEMEMNGNGGDGSVGTESMQKLIISKYPARPKLIISICLLQSANHQCSTLIYQFLSKQLTAEALINAVYNVYIPKNYSVDNLFNEILLLLTLAIHHPAFTYEERDLLTKQKEDVEKVLAGVNAYFLQSALQQTAGALAAIQQPPPPPSQAPPQASQNAIGGSTGPPQAGQPTYVATAGQHNPAHTQHPQPQSQPVHAYHYGPQHPVVSSTGKLPPQPQATHLAAAIHPQATFQIPFLQSSVPIANLTYTPQPPTPQQAAAASAQVANQTNAVMQSMSILRINSPPSISSTSPSPTISPSSTKMTAGHPPMTVPNQQQQQQQVTIKLDSMYTSAAGLPPNSLVTLPFLSGGDPTGGPGTGGGGGGGSTLAQPIPYLSLPPGQPIIPDDMQPKASSSVSSNSSISSSASCYNCGHLGHRGTECTTGGDDR